MYRHIFSCCLVLAVATTASAQATQPTFKAIWEPITFKQDIELTAIACTGPETCWVAGAKSTILHTTDGGKTWKVQLGGDPQATDEDLDSIEFVDDKHGWAMTEGRRVLATTDGSTWAEVAKLSGTSRGLAFLSSGAGFVNDNGDSQSRSMMSRSTDGGKTWKRELACSVDAVVDGLSRQLGCMMRVTQFVNAQVGFMGGVTSGTTMAAFSKTVDGGKTWTNSVIPATKHTVDSIHFWSEKDGLVLLASGQTQWTADGGATWTGSTSPPEWRSFFASGQGKIIVGIRENGRQAGYSFNGGRNFSSRALGLPANARDVEFPDPTHGYLVGQHGMAYRYRIVPTAYTVPGMIGAAANPNP